MDNIADPKRKLISRVGIQAYATLSAFILATIIFVYFDAVTSFPC